MKTANGDKIVLNAFARKMGNAGSRGGVALAFAAMLSAMPLGALTATDAAAQNVIRIADSGAGVSKRIALGLNKAVVVDLPREAGDILVADPEIADAVTRTSRRLYLFGKEVGQTNIFVFGPNGEEIVALDLKIERDISGLEAQLARFIPNSNINVEIINDNIVLDGTVQTPQDAEQASRLATIFLTGGEATTRNITATGEGGSPAIFAEDRQKSQIVNLLTIEGEDQVTLKVTVAEVNRQVLKQLGFENTVNVAGSLAAQVVTQNNPIESLLSSSQNGTGNRASLGGQFGDFGFNSTIRAMEQAGVMRTLAEPTLTAISGEAAEFRVGGTIYISAATNDNGVLTTTLIPVEYGIGLDFTPVVLGPGRISLKIGTEVSEPSQTSSSGQLSIRERTASTSVELPSGGSIVIAGLLNDNSRQIISGTPGLSEIPVLGTLFRSRDFVRNETELVIIATPYLVRPTARSELARPDDNFNVASDGAGYFLGRVNRVFGRMDTDLPKGRYHGVVGFIYK